MAIYIDDTIVLRKLHQWLAAAADADLTVLRLGEMTPDGAAALVVARLVGLVEVENQDRHTTDDNDVETFTAEIIISTPESQTSLFAVTTASSKVRQAMECKGDSVTGHEISTDGSRRSFTMEQEAESEVYRVCRMLLRGSVRCTSTAAPEDRID